MSEERNPSSRHSPAEPSQGHAIGLPDAGPVAADRQLAQSLGRWRPNIIAAAIGVLAGIAFYVWMYVHSDAWQMLVAAGSILCAVGCAAMAYVLFKRRRLNGAIYLIILALYIAYGGPALGFSGVTLYLAVSGAAVILLTCSLVLPRKWDMWLVLTGLYAVAVWLVDWLEPLPRYDVSRLPAVQIFIVGASGLMLLAGLWQITRSLRLRTIRARLIAAFTLIVLLLAGVITLASVVVGLQIGRQQAVRNLSSVLTFKEERINAWLNELQTDLADVVREDEMVIYAPGMTSQEALVHMRYLLTKSPQEPLYPSIRRRLRDVLDQAVKRSDSFGALLVVDLQGRVLCSTHTAWEGSYLGTQSFVQEGPAGPYVQPLNYSPLVGRVTLFLSHPVTDMKGQVLGLVVALADLEALDAVMLESVGLGETGDTYLISPEHALLTATRFERPGSTFTGLRFVYTEGAKAALAAQSDGYLLYDGYNHRPVVGVYRWLPQLQVALLAEQDQAEAYSATYVPLLAISGVTLAFALLVVLGSLVFARGITAPLSYLAETARQIAAGDLGRVAQVERDDEVGAVADAFNRMTAQLRGLIDSLEQRVAERTRDLELRSVRMEVAADVAREAAAIRDIDRLLDATVRLISDRFGFYHAGIFLLDQRGEYAVLRAASSEGGQRMLALGHKLRVGEVGIVGAATGTGRPHIALDVGADAVFFDNPHLPHTRSEMTLPLKVRDAVIGALDVQSTEEAAFTNADVAILQTMADQLALAIDNARLLEESQRALRELQATYGEYARSAWAGMDELPGFEYDQVAVKPVDAEADMLLNQALGAGQAEAVVVSDDGHSTLVAPLRLRDQVIGAVALQGAAERRQWSQDDIHLVETVGEQVALALEGARLFEETHRRAREMTTLFDISRALTGAVLEPEAIGEILAAQLSELMGASAFISLFHPEENKIRLLAEYRSAEDKGRGWAPVEDYYLAEYPATAGVIETLQPLVVQISDTDADPAELAYMEKYGIKTLAILPMAVKGQAVGVVELQAWDRERRYTQEQLNMALTVANQGAVTLENARLFREARLRAEELAALNDLAQALTARTTVDEVLEETYRGAARLLDTTNFYVALYHRDRDEVIFALDVTEGRLTKPYTGRRSGNGLTEYVIRTRQSLLIADNLPERLEELGLELIGPVALTWLGVPLLVGDQIIGVIAVQSYAAAHAYGEHERELLTAIANQTAIAIQSAYLFEEVQRRATQLAAAAEVARDATAILDVDQLLSETVDLISERFGFYHAGVFLLDELGEYAVLKAASSAGGQRMLRRGHRLRVGEVGIVGYVTGTGEHRIALDVGEDAVHFVNPDLPETRSEMALPLISRGRVIGALDVQSTEPGAFTEDDVAVLQTMADQLATAIENARLYQEAVQTAERLAEVDRLKSQFLANMSHELRTPLNSIIGFSRVILKGIDGPLTDLQRQDLEAIFNSGQHLLGLINDILDISKIEAGKMDLAFEPVDMADVVRGVMSTAIALVKDKPVELQQSVPPDLPPVIADGRRIRQVLLNLVSNAAKFTNEGFIRVEVAASDDVMTVSVVDSGIGIPADKLPTIFEAFTQADASPSRKYGGTGLGLTISKSFIGLHDGEIWVESEPGVGSTFHFTLPIRGPRSLRQEGEPPEDELPDTDEEEIEPEPDGKLILCVEDDEGVITLFRRYLHRQGYRIVGLTDSSRAVAEAKRLQPHAITLDVMMPGKDGWQVIRELKADPETQHIPVVMCTIVSEKGRGMSLGAADYLVKPVLEQDLLAALDRLDREQGHHRVLVVDDHPEDRSLLRRIIESQEGYEVVEASGGQEAIAMVRQERPHLIILDLLMPEVDGFAVLEAVKANEATRSIPIIVVTAKELTDEDHHFLNHHIEALVQKGVLEQQELLEDVAAALLKLSRPQPTAGAKG